MEGKLMQQVTDKLIKEKKKEIAKKEDALKILEAKKKIADDRQKAENDANLEKFRTHMQNVNDVIKKSKRGK